MTEILSPERGLREFALDTARRAGHLLCEFSNRQHTINHKSTVIDLVTEADLASERLIVAAIRARFPDHTIQSEEGLGDLNAVTQGVPHLWLVDPLDGTVNYAHGYPSWGVSLALAEADEKVPARQAGMVLGVVYDPLRDEIFWAERGQGAWLKWRPPAGFQGLQAAGVAAGHRFPLPAGFPGRQQSG